MSSSRRQTHGGGGGSAAAHSAAPLPLQHPKPRRQVDDDEKEDQDGSMHDGSDERDDQQQTYTDAAEEHASRASSAEGPAAAATSSAQASGSRTRGEDSFAVPAVPASRGQAAAAAASTVPAAATAAASFEPPPRSGIPSMLSQMISLIRFPGATQDPRPLSSIPMLSEQARSVQAKLNNLMVPAASTATRDIAVVQRAQALLSGREQVFAPAHASSSTAAAPAAARGSAAAAASSAASWSTDRPMSSVVIPGPIAHAGYMTLTPEPVRRSDSAAADQRMDRLMQSGAGHSNAMGPPAATGGARSSQSAGSAASGAAVPAASPTASSPAVGSPSSKSSGAIHLRNWWIAFFDPASPSLMFAQRDLDVPSLATGPGERKMEFDNVTLTHVQRHLSKQIQYGTAFGAYPADLGRRFVPWVILNGTRDSAWEREGMLCHSSALSQRQSPNQVSTMTGRHYILEGPPNRQAMENAEWDPAILNAFAEGFPPQWKELLYVATLRRYRMLGLESGLIEQQKQWPTGVVMASPAPLSSSRGPMAAPSSGRNSGWDMPPPPPRSPWRPATAAAGPASAQQQQQQQQRQQASQLMPPPSPRTPASTASKAKRRIQLQSPQVSNGAAASSPSAARSQSASTVRPAPSSQPRPQQRPQQRPEQHRAASSRPPLLAEHPSQDESLSDEDEDAEDEEDEEDDEDEDEDLPRVAPASARSRQQPQQFMSPAASSGRHRPAPSSAAAANAAAQARQPPRSAGPTPVRRTIAPSASPAASPLSVRSKRRRAEPQPTDVSEGEEEDDEQREEPERVRVKPEPVHTPRSSSASAKKRKAAPKGPRTAPPAAKRARPSPTNASPSKAASPARRNSTAPPPTIVKLEAHELPKSSWSAMGPSTNASPSRAPSSVPIIVPSSFFGVIGSHAAAAAASAAAAAAAAGSPARLRAASSVPMLLSPAAIAARGAQSASGSGGGATASSTWGGMNPFGSRTVTPLPLMLQQHVKREPLPAAPKQQPLRPKPRSLVQAAAEGGAAPLFHFDAPTSAAVPLITAPVPAPAVSVSPSAPELPSPRKRRLDGFVECRHECGCHDASGVDLPQFGRWVAPSQLTRHEQFSSRHPHHGPNCRVPMPGDPRHGEEDEQMPALHSVADSAVPSPRTSARHSARPLQSAFVAAAAAVPESALVSRLKQQMAKRTRSSR